VKAAVRVKLSARRWVSDIGIDPGWMERRSLSLSLLCQPAGSEVVGRALMVVGNTSEVGRGKWRPGKKERRMAMMMGRCSISTALLSAQE